MRNITGLQSHTDTQRRSTIGIRIGITFLMMLLSVSASVCRGQQPSWAPNGVGPFPPLSRSNISTLTHDGLGGACLWTYGYAPGWKAVRLVRLTAAGVPDPSWPTNGAQLPGRWDGGTLLDGAGGFLLFLSIQAPDYDIGAMHLSSTGLPVPGWGDSTGVVRLFRSNEWDDYFPSAVIDGAGGLFVGWESLTPQGTAIRLQRLAGSGLPAAGWPDTGIVLCSLPGVRTQVSLCRDAVGGVYATWTDQRSGSYGVYSQRVSGQGEILWTAHPLGRPVAVAARDHATLGSASDDAGGVFVSVFDVVDTGFGFETDVYLQRLLANGEFAPGFSSAPKPISLYPGDVQNLSIIADGSGGAYMKWDDYRTGGLDFYVQRVSPAGTPMPGWPVGGLAVGNEPGRLELRGQMVTDMQGGLYCAYNSEGNDGTRVRLQHLRGDGSLAPGWPPIGVNMAPVQEQYAIGDHDAFLDSDGRGGVILAWSRQYQYDYLRNGVYAQRFGPASVVATTLSLVSSRAEPGRVALEWQVGGDALLSAVLERRTQDDAQWTALGTLTPDGERRLHYEDRSITPGGRYAYRLVYQYAATQHTSAESWIDIPTAHVFALHGASRNPAPRATLALDLSLRGTAAATLELYDVGGRRVVTRDLRGTAPGRRNLTVPEAASLEPGLYWARLREGSDEARARIVLLR